MQPFFTSLSNVPIHPRVSHCSHWSELLPPGLNSKIIYMQWSPSANVQINDILNCDIPWFCVLSHTKLVQTRSCEHGWLFISSSQMAVPHQAHLKEDLKCQCRIRYCVPSLTTCFDTLYQKMKALVQSGCGPRSPFLLDYWPRRQNPVFFLNFLSLYAFLVFLPIIFFKISYFLTKDEEAQPCFHKEDMYTLLGK